MNDTAPSGSHHALTVWLLPLTDPAPDAWWHCLDADERGRAEHIRRAVERDRFVAAHALLRAQLTTVAGRSAAAWRFQRGDRGKPRLVDDGTVPAVTFSLTHTRGLVAAAVDPGGRAIGLDAERLDRALAPGLARRLLTADERPRLAGLDEAGHRAAVLHRWVLKEAVAKATGQGVALGLRRVAFTSTRRPEPVFEPDPILGKPSDWQLRAWTVSGHHRLALAVHAGNHAVRLWRVRELRPADLDRLLAASP